GGARADGNACRAESRCHGFLAPQLAACERYCAPRSCAADNRCVTTTRSRPAHHCAEVRQLTRAPPAGRAPVGPVVERMSVGVFSTPLPPPDEASHAHARAN